MGKWISLWDKRTLCGELAVLAATAANEGAFAAAVQLLVSLNFVRRREGFVPGILQAVTEQLAEGWYHDKFANANLAIEVVQEQGVPLEERDAVLAGTLSLDWNPPSLDELRAWAAQVSPLGRPWGPAWRTVVLAALGVWLALDEEDQYRQRREGAWSGEAVDALRNEFRGYRRAVFTLKGSHGLRCLFEKWFSSDIEARRKLVWHEGPEGDLYTAAELDKDGSVELFEPPGTAAFPAEVVEAFRSEQAHECIPRYSDRDRPALGLMLGPDAYSRLRDAGLAKAATGMWEHTEYDVEYWQFVQPEPELLGRLAEMFGPHYVLGGRN